MTPIVHLEAPGGHWHKVNHLLLGERGSRGAPPCRVEHLPLLCSAIEPWALRVERWALNSPNDNAALIDLIHARIRARGPVPFSWFMEQALYHPEHGYYSSGRAAIGREGDYFTNVSVGPVFGQLLAAQFAEIWERLGNPPDFVIVEQGAHDGQFARDALEHLQKNAPKFFGALRYRIIEPFTIWRDRQNQTLQPFRDKVEWSDKLAPFTGIHFSNELLDAFPIDLPGKMVGLEGDTLVFVEAPVDLTRPFNQAALDWIDDVAANLQRGYLIAIDYGRWADNFVPVIHTRAQHRYLDSPFEQIGHADITAHLDWKSIMLQTLPAGLAGGHIDQHHFLAGILAAWPGVIRDEPASKRQLQTLLHPEMMGRAFQVLALSKNVHPALPLSGFKFGSLRDVC